MNESAKLTSTGLAAKIRAATGTLSRAERRVVRILHATNFRAGMASVANLAAQAEVSGPTVIRFTSRLGYASYRSFQEAAEVEFAERVESPATLYQRGRIRSRSTDLDAVSSNIINSVRETFNGIDPVELDKIIKVLANERRHTCTIGGRGTDVFAHMLAARLYQIRPNARAVGAQPLGFSQEDQLAFMGPRDVVVAFDFRRYEESTIFFARTAASKGATVVLFTDAWLSPIADFASHVITISSDSSSGPYDYWTPCLGLLEAMLEILTSEMDPEVIGERIRLSEQYSRGLLAQEDSPASREPNEGEPE